MPENEKPLILTLKLDGNSQRFFDTQRERYFPPERNYLKAHLTLFHQLPHTPETLDFLANFHCSPFEMQVSGLRHLGAGVAYELTSPELKQLHDRLRKHFEKCLIPQDRQPFRPHITIQNKVKPDQSKRLLTLLANSFEPFEIKALGLELWAYLGGPWQHVRSISF